MGYSTSLLGTGMAPVAVAFAVLNNGGTATDLGFVISGSVLMTVICLPLGGVVADRFGRRAVMLGSDTVRSGAQGAFAALVLIGHPPLLALVGASAVGGAATGFFSPALTALTPELVPKDDLHDANVLIGFATNVGRIAGPATAGALIVLTNPGAVVAIDATSYVISVISLSLLQLTQIDGPAQRLLAGLRDGWSAWRSRSWIWITDIKFALFNAVVYAPFLVLGPIVAKRHLGGPTAWGLILTAQGAGAVITGLAIMGHRPSRPLVVVTIAQAAWALPLAGLALLLPVPAIAAAAFVAGIGSAAFVAIWNTTLQRNVPAQVLARVSSYDYLGSFALGPLGLALVGPLATKLGTANILWFGAVWQVVSTLAVLGLPQVRHFTDPSTTSPVPE